jgi:hypothetical protein
VSLAHTLATRPAFGAVELRPPRATLDRTAGIDAWIDTHVFLTDNAVGAREEHNLRHMVANLGNDAPRERVVPFLTTKHPLDYCLAYADRAWELGWEFYPGRRIRPLMMRHAALNAACTLVREVELGDHVMLVGEVIEAGDPEDVGPVAFHGGKYFELGRRIPKPPDADLKRVREVVAKHRRTR